jgi:hypothetical protein
VAFRSRQPPQPQQRRLASSLGRWGLIELGYRFDPIQSRILIGRNQVADLHSHTPTNRPQARVGHDKPQLAQTALAAALAHLPHTFRWRSHAAFSMSPIFIVTRYASQDNHAS